MKAIPRKRSAHLAVLALALGLAAKVHGQAVVQEFLVPLPEDQLRSTLLKLYSSTGTTFDSVVSVVANAAGTRVVYDHWEDGYEIDLSAPVQASTRVWGDGNNANGIAPGFVNDPVGLPAGTVLPLRNNVPLPRNPATVLYDGRDRIGATKAIVVSRASWATTPGSVLAGAVEVSATLDYGTDFVSPVGENVSAASMFEVVDLYVMAAHNGTTVNIDKDANGSFETVLSLNRGESYRVNGGVLKGARVTSSKPIQAHLITGDIGANYESRWFTLYPVNQWSDTYYTPVGTAADGDQAYVFVYNPGAGAITVNVATVVGSTSFGVASNGTYQYLMPQNSGASFTSAGGEPFFALETVGANPAANNVHDWGFTLVPEGNLTPIALVGWGPGSSDLSRNGSPVWVTAVKNTTIYVDYNGDLSGPFTDPEGNGYDVSYSLAALQSRTIYDPDKDQTAMRVYTLDGTLITAAWGQDPATAAPGNPFLDLGTTVLPFPVPVIRKSSEIAAGGDVNPPGLSVGDTLEYSITIDNKSIIVLGNVVVLDAPPPSLQYVTNSTSRDGVAVADKADPTTAFPLDEGGYIIPLIPRGGSTTFKYKAVVLTSGSILNGAVGGGSTATNVVEVPPLVGADLCGLLFTDGGGTGVVAYAEGADIYVTLDDLDANINTTAVDTVDVVVENTSNGDLEIITLVETGVDTGVFRNIAALPSSTTTGVGQQDGILFAAAGESLSVAYTDPLYLDTCSDAAAIAVESETKVLYLSTDGTGSPDQDLDRRDPVALGDFSTATSGVVSVDNFTVATEPVVSTNAAFELTTTALTSLSVSHTTGTDENRLMLVGISTEDDNTANLNVTAVRYVVGTVTQSLTKVIERASAVEAVAEIWQLVAPSSGAGTLTATISSGTADDDEIFMGVATFSGVDQAVPLGTNVSAIGNSLTATVNIPSATGELVFDTLGFDDSRAVTVGGGQSELWNGATRAPGNGVTGGASTEPGAATVTMSWDATTTADTWALCAVTIRPAPPVTNIVVFTQTPTMCDDFSMPAGGLISATAFVSTTGTWAFEKVLTFSNGSRAENLVDFPVLVHLTSTNFNFSVTQSSGQDIRFFDSNGTTALAYQIESWNAAGQEAFIWVKVPQIDASSNIDSIRMQYGNSSAVDAQTPSAVWSSGYQAVYHLDEDPTTSSGLFADSSASGFTATNNGTTDAAGFIGRAQDFNAASSQYINLGSGRAFLNNVGQATLSCWLNADVTNGSPQYISLSINNGGAGSTSSRAGLEIFGNEAEGFGRSTDGGAAQTATTTTGPISTGTWHYVCVVIDYAGDSISVYVNGVAQATSGTVAFINAATPNTSSDNAALGAEDDGSSGFIDARLDEVRISDVARSALWVDAQYSSMIDTFITFGSEQSLLGAVTARLKNDTSLFATLTSPTVTGLGGDDYRLDWAGVLASSTNVANGESVVLEVETAGTAAFTILYDSSNYPSRVSLPATTVIRVDALQVFDAPYPGGIPTASEAAGAVLYVRATVSDPFGAYDITGLDMVITNAGIGVSLDDTAVVASNSCSKTYEYAWQTTAEGNYEIAVTAHEGTEGITDTAATSVSLTFLDLGTPCSTEFTIGDNGPITDLYATNQTVCARVVDLDQNTNTGVVETVSATITTSSSDAETVILTETGADTGIFTTCLPASATVDGGDENGTLYAPPGAVLDVAYTDPTDPTDPCSDTAIVPLPSGTPGLALTKTLVLPADGQAVVGETVRFNISVANVGSTVLSNVALVDTFPAAKLTYQSASPSPDIVAAGSLTWTNIGPLAVGASEDFDVTFAALASSPAATNVAVANAGGGLTATGTAQVVITSPTIGVSKTILSPAPGPATYGSNVLYRIVVQNTGDTAIETLPLEDTFSAAYLTYVSATIAPDGVGAGSLLWNDLTGTGALAVAAAITNEITLRVVGAGNPADNTAAAAYAVDVNGDPVPPVSSVTGIVTVAASISGHVYDDLNTNGAFNAGEPGIDGVTLSLYTDPNGDGDPADGTLVQIVSTVGTNGFYEFLNLGTGTYVVVEADPSAYASSGDTGGANDNRIPVNAASFSEFAGNDFFDYLPPAGSYSTISGTVWNDADASATVDVGETGLADVTLGLYWDANSNGVADVGEALYASALTDTNGFYFFAGIPPGNYVIVETDPVGYASTADTAGANDNRIPVSVSGGAPSSGNDFLDVSTVTIGDFVWLDADGNGIQDGGEAGISNLTVRLLDASSNVVATTVTDTNGMYLFSGSLPGDYLVEFVLPGGYQFTTRDAGGDDTVDSDADTVSGRTAPFALVAGETTLTADAGLYQPASLSGAVRYDVDGDGDLGDGDAGVAGVVVSLYNIDSGTVLVGTAVTDSNGAYSFTNLPPGNYRVIETDPPGYLSTADADGGTGFQASRITLALTSGQSLIDQDFLDINLVSCTDHEELAALVIPGGASFPAGSTNYTMTFDNGFLPYGHSLDPNWAGTVSFAYTQLDPLNQANAFLLDGSRYTTMSDFNPGDIPTRSGKIYVVYGRGTTAFNGSGLGGTNTHAWEIAYDFSGLTNGYLPVGTLLGMVDVDGKAVDGESIVVSAVLDGGASDPFLEYYDDAPNPEIGHARGSYDATTNTFTWNGQNSVNNDALFMRTTENLVSMTLRITQGSAGSSLSLKLAAPVVDSDCIEGSVYNDIADDNTLNGTGETGIPGVLITLYTDPNMDGDPSDGVPVASTVTDGAGRYDFPMQPSNSYVIVEADPPGAVSDDDVSGSPTDNRVALTLDGVTGSSGNDFLDDMSVATNLFDISGTAYVDGPTNDLAFSADDVAGAGLAVFLYADVNGDGIAQPGELAGTTNTAADGTYVFPDVPDGTYLVVQGNLPDYQSVDDTQGSGVDNKVAVTVSGANSAGNDFLDVPLGTLAGHLYVDSDGNGTQGPGEPDLPRITINVTDNAGEVHIIETDDNGNWSILILQGPATADVITADSDFPAGYTQTEGTDPTASSVVGGATTDGGTDGYTPPNPGTVYGHLYIDADGDGTQDVGELNLTNISVRVTDTNGFTQVVVTDTNGNWSATVPAGVTTADVDETSPGFPAAYTQTEGTDPTTVTAISASSVDAGNDGYAPWPVILGAVLLDVNGNGLSDAEDTNGIAGVTIELLDAATNVVATTITGAGGGYSFTNQPPGSYTVRETDPIGYLSTGDTQGTNDNRIAVTVTYGETSTGNNFLDTLPATISGSVLLDVNGNGVQDGPDTNGIGSVTVQLLDASSNVVATTTTSAGGAYSFTNLPPGSYTVRETDPAGYLSTGDTQGANDNRIAVTVTSGQTSAGNNFLDVLPSLESYRSNYTTVTNLYYRDPELTGQTQDVIYVGGATYVASTNYDVAYYDRDGWLVYTDTGASTTSNGFLQSLDPNTNANVTYGTWTAVTVPDGYTPAATKAAQLADTNSLTTDVFDVVTWSTTTFTDSNGVPVSVYGSSNGTGVVYMETIDRDQNQNTNAIETITVTLTNAATGDSETVTLYETGPNTGVFANNGTGQRLAFPITNAGPAIPGNGALSFENGDTLQVRYTDPNDPADKSGDSVPTRVLLSAFTAQRVAGGVRVAWETSSEFDTAGFDVEREVDGLRARVNGALLAALPPAPAGARYALLDRNAPATGAVQYWLLEAEMTGGRNQFGPASVTTDGAPARSTTTALATDDAEFTRTIDAAPLAAAAARRAEAQQEAASRTAAALAPMLPVQPAAEGLPALKINTGARGVYGLTPAAIAVAAGVDTSVVDGLIASGRLHLKNLGRTATWTLIDGRVAFFADALADRYARQNVFWLEGGPGTRMAARTLAPASAVMGLDYPETRHVETNRFALVASVQNAQDDLWMWDFIQAGNPTTGKKSFSFQIDALADSATPASLVVRLAGSTKSAASPDHHVVLAINGQDVAEAAWDGVGAHTVSGSFDQSILRAGSNTLTVTGLLDAGMPFSVFYLNNFDVTYRRQYQAVAGALACLPAGHATVTVTNFAGADIHVFEIGDPRRPVEIFGTLVDGAPGAYRVSFRTRATDRSYYVFEGAAVGAPASVRARPLPDLRGAANTADVLLIAPASLEAAAGTLAGYRAGQGWDARFIDVEDAYDAFTYGLPNPEAIRRLLLATGAWAVGPRYGLLIGAGTYDFQNDLGYGECLIPPRVISTPVGVLPSDESLGDLVGDAVPEVIVGRLPVLSASELQRAIAKIQRYEQDVAPASPALLASDNADASGNFPGDSRAFSPDLGADTVALDLLPGQTAAFRTALFGQLRAGSRIFNWSGHGGISALANESVLKTADVPGLNNASKPTVMVALSCLLGQFALPGVDALGELLATSSNGAAAVWAPAGQAYHRDSMLMGRGFYGQVGLGGTVRLGDAVRAAHVAYRTHGALAHLPQMYNLLGDPTLGLAGIAGPPTAAERAATAWVPPSGPIGGEDIADTPPPGSTQSPDVVDLSQIKPGFPGDTIDLRFRGSPGAAWPAYGVEFSTNLVADVWQDYSAHISVAERTSLADGSALVVISVDLPSPQPLGFLRVRSLP